jgi:hypothetical protein
VASLLAASATTESRDVPGIRPDKKASSGQLPVLCLAGGILRFEAVLSAVLSGSTIQFGETRLAKVIEGGFYAGQKISGVSERAQY